MSSGSKDVNVNWEIMKRNKHQRQIIIKLIIYITETKNYYVSSKSSMYRAVHITKSDVNKILEVFLPLTLSNILFIYYV